jgi:hypothetical protein
VSVAVAAAEVMLNRAFFSGFFFFFFIFGNVVFNART